MDFKKVAKSKSSNGAIGGKAENKKNKKSLSNAQFQTSVVKKRGVYVEKKIQSSSDTQEANANTISQMKPPRRPRPGQKKFLASVLTILSKSTTGTQYPDILESMKDNTRFSENKRRKTKYRSRVLNDEMLKSEKEQLIILQPKKEITQTPSSNSFRGKPASDHTKSLEGNEPKRSAIRDILENTIYSGVAEGVTKEVLESQPKKEKKLRINDDPETIASEIAKTDDKNMYEFFVDLLETTISVYNVKTEYEISDVSKTALELDDTIVQKLEIKNNPSHETLNFTSKRERTRTIENDTFGVIERLPTDVTPPVYRPATKSKIKAKSFYKPKFQIDTREDKIALKSKSFDNNNKYNRKTNKKQILNDLKEELARHTYFFNEPESLYDALKIMAKNKRRNKKSIQFVNRMDNGSNHSDFECMFERKKVISFGSRKYNQVKQQLPTSELKKNTKTENLSKIRYPPSSHSLQVYGFDYEEPAKVQESKRQRRIILNYHSSASISKSNLDDYNALTDSSNSNYYSGFNLK